MSALSVVYEVSTYVIPAIIAITFHEAAHGWMASRLGDDTARLLGRVTFNPLRHIDPVGTILLPGMLLLSGTGFLFGWAKPVPVNFRRLRNPRRDMVLVAAAGPGINFLLALGSALALRPTDGWQGLVADWIQSNLWNSVTFNVVLALFNLIPLPPLDGGRILVGLLPPDLARPFARIEKFGLAIMIALMILVPVVTRELGHPFSPIAELLGPPLEFLLRGFERIAGVP